MRTHRYFTSCRSAVAMLAAVLMAGFLSNPFAIAAPARGKAARSQPMRQTCIRNKSTDGSVRPAKK